LATLLSRSPDSQLISRLALLGGDGSPIGVAHTALGEAAARTNEEDAGREYFDLLIDLGRGSFLPYSSHYLTGTLYGRPLARLRQTLQLLGIEKTGDRSEPEDHVAIPCEIMAGLIGGAFASPGGADREFFGQHLAPWIRRFFVENGVVRRLIRNGIKCIQYGSHNARRWPHRTKCERKSCFAPVKNDLRPSDQRICEGARYHMSLPTSVARM